MGTNRLPPCVNFHVWPRCDMHCRFCFSQDLPRPLAPEDALRVVQLLAPHAEKITFSGGEPTLCPHLPELAWEAKRLGLTTCLVTNGHLLFHAADLAETLLAVFDWVALSVDSVDPEVNRESGRCVGGVATLTVEQYLEVCRCVRRHGARLKINTVVHRHNKLGDLRPFIRSARPGRWKILQALPVAGQNAEQAEGFAISDREFRLFTRRNGRDAAPRPIVEPCPLITGSYCMVDPQGRFFDNVSGAHHYSRSVLEAGVIDAFSEVRFCRRRFERRGGHYDWSHAVRNRSPPRAATVTAGRNVASRDSRQGGIVTEHMATEGPIRWQRNVRR